MVRNLTDRLLWRRFTIYFRRNEATRRPVDIRATSRLRIYRASYRESAVLTGTGDAQTTRRPSDFCLREVAASLQSQPSDRKRVRNGRKLAQRGHLELRKRTSLQLRQRCECLPKEFFVLYSNNYRTLSLFLSPPPGRQVDAHQISHQMPAEIVRFIFGEVLLNGFLEDTMTLVGFCSVVQLFSYLLSSGLCWLILNVCRIVNNSRWSFRISFRNLSPYAITRWTLLWPTSIVTSFDDHPHVQVKGTVRRTMVTKYASPWSTVDSNHANGWWKANVV